MDQINQVLNIEERLNSEDPNESGFSSSNDSIVQTWIEDERDELAESKNIIPLQQITANVEEKNEAKQHEEQKHEISKVEDIPMNLIKHGVSLKPDMIFGWKPEVEASNPPIPFYFDFVEHNLWRYQLDTEKDVIIYQERRAKDSYILHKWFSNQSLANNCVSYQFKFPQHFENGKFKYDKILNEIFGERSDCQTASGAAEFIKGDSDYDFIGMNPLCNVKNSQVGSKEYDYLVFDSQFECGNLDLVIKVGQEKHLYDIFLRPDTNSSGHFQWFYFKVQNKCKGTNMKLRIMNMTKKNSLYLQGMTINIYSQKKCNETGQGWYKGGSNIKYKLSSQNNNGDDQEDSDDQDDQPQSKKHHQILQFEYEFEYENDEVQFAYSIPYTYSMLNQYIYHIMEQQRQSQTKIVESSILTTTLGGVDVPLLTITNFNDGIPQPRKKVVIITARVHPGETHSSHIMHGLLRFLVSQDKMAHELRKRVIFKIIPMLNPDGVIVGNNRTSFIGKDVNRCFIQPNPKLTPEAFQMRDLIKQLQNQDKDRILAYIDIHAHSGRKSIFMYGPYYPLHSRKYLKIRMLSKILSERTEMFRYYSCKFRLEKYKEGCARIALWRDFNITNCFTIECSAYGYINKERDTVSYTEQVLNEFSENLGTSLFEYLLILEEDQNQKIELAKRLQKKLRTKRKTIKEIIGFEPLYNNHMFEEALMNFQEFEDSDDDYEFQKEQKDKQNMQHKSLSPNKMKKAGNGYSSEDEASPTFLSNRKRGIQKQLTGQKQQQKNVRIKSQQKRKQSPQTQQRFKRTKSIHSPIQDRTQYNNKRDNPNEPDEDSAIIKPVRINTPDLSSNSSSSDSDFDKYFKPNFRQGTANPTNRNIQQHTNQNNVKRTPKEEIIGGFQVFDAEELFMLLYNQKYEQWIILRERKRKEEFNKAQKDRLFSINKDRLYLKEIRTVEEVMQSIKKKVQREECDREDYYQEEDQNNKEREREREKEKDQLFEKNQDINKNKKLSIEIVKPEPIIQLIENRTQYDSSSSPQKIKKIPKGKKNIPIVNQPSLEKNLFSKKQQLMDSMRRSQVDTNQLSKSNISYVKYDTADQKRLFANNLQLQRLTNLIKSNSNNRGGKMVVYGQCKQLNINEYVIEQKESRHYRDEIIRRKQQISANKQMIEYQNEGMIGHQQQRQHSQNTYNSNITSKSRQISQRVINETYNHQYESNVKNSNGTVQPHSNSMNNQQVQKSYYSNQDLIQSPIKKQQSDIKNQTQNKFFVKRGSQGLSVQEIQDDFAVNIQEHRGTRIESQTRASVYIAESKTAQNSFIYHDDMFNQNDNKSKERERDNSLKNDWEPVQITGSNIGNNILKHRSSQSKNKSIYAEQQQEYQQIKNNPSSFLNNKSDINKRDSLLFKVDISAKEIKHKKIDNKAAKQQNIKDLVMINQQIDSQRNFLSTKPIQIKNNIQQAIDGMKHIPTKEPTIQQRKTQQNYYQAKDNSDSKDRGQILQQKLNSQQDPYKSKKDFKLDQMK